MSVVRMLARPMLASMFVTAGTDAVLHPEPKADRAGDVGPTVARKLPIPLPDDPVQLVRINGAVQVVAGLMLATGRLPRLSALAIAATLVPTTYAGHRFWEEKDPTRRTAQRLHFFKNMSMFGGLLIAAVDTGGKPSLAHRGRDAAHRMSHKVRS
jgi:putative oxidoreductase